MGERSPLSLMIDRAHLTRQELAVYSGVHRGAILKLEREGEEAYRLPILQLVKLAVCLGCAPVEILPALGKRPSRGILWDRGVFRRKRVGGRRALSSSTGGKVIVDLGASSEAESRAPESSETPGG